MARTISVADDVFEWLKKEKGDRSYSDLLRDLRDKKSNFSQVNGMKVSTGVEGVVEKASEESMEDIEEKFK